MPANTSEHEVLNRFLEDRGVDPRGVADKLEAYEALLRRWNVRQNLVSRRDIGRLRSRHVLESLALLGWWDGRLGDVGSGAGFPGVPLAIARPNAGVALIERSSRKARFLEQVVIELGLPNVEVLECDVGAQPLPVRCPEARLFDTVTARAVAPPPAAWKLARGLLRKGGHVLLQSGTPLSPGTFDGGEIRGQERCGATWITVVGHARRAPEETGWRGA